MGIYQRVINSVSRSHSSVHPRPRPLHKRKQSIETNKALSVFGTSTRPRTLSRDRNALSNVAVSTTRNVPQRVERAQTGLSKFLHFSLGFLFSIEYFSRADADFRTPSTIGDLCHSSRRVQQLLTAAVINQAPRGNISRWHTGTDLFKPKSGLG